MAAWDEHCCQCSLDCMQSSTIETCAWLCMRNAFETIRSTLVHVLCSCLFMMLMLLPVRMTGRVRTLDNSDKGKEGTLYMYS